MEVKLIRLWHESLIPYLPRRHCCEFENVELGFPSQYDDIIKEYAEDDNYTRTVYGYVPIELVEKLIEKHGGIVDVKSC